MRARCPKYKQRSANLELIPGCAKIHGLKDYSMLVDGRLALTKTLMALTLTLPYYPKHIPLPTYNFPTPFLCPLMSQMSSCQLLQFLGPLKSLNHTYTLSSLPLPFWSWPIRSAHPQCILLPSSLLYSSLIFDRLINNVYMYIL